jgi:hypothetical protein
VSGGWLTRVLLAPEYPLLGLEVRPRALAAVRLERDGGRIGLGAAAVVELPEGALDVSLARPNLVDPRAFRETARSALERVGALGGGGISLALPDPVVRLTLLPAEGLRGRRAEIEQILRFRLHKALPFDVREARLAWEGPFGDHVLAAVGHEPVLDGYERAIEDLGFRVGLLEATGLSLLSLLDREPITGDRLLVNWDEGYVSFALTRGGRPVLLRTLADDSAPDAVLRHAASTLQFHRDRLGGGALEDAVLRVAHVPAAEATEALAPVLGLRPRLLQPWQALGVADGGTSAQPLAGATACALRAAA